MRIEKPYPVSPASLLATLTDPEYLAERVAKFGGIGDPVLSADDGVTRVVVARQLPMDKLPPAAAPFVGDGQLVQTDEWQQASEPPSGTWKVAVGTAPVDLQGTYVIEPTTDGCRYVIEATVKVNVPFFGRQLEPQIANYLRSLIEAEQEFLGEWVEAH